MCASEDAPVVCLAVVPLSCAPFATIFAMFQHVGAPLAMDRAAEFIYLPQLTYINR
jgi:hypothetical protein